MFKEGPSCDGSFEKSSTKQCVWETGFTGSFYFNLSDKKRRFLIEMNKFRLIFVYFRPSPDLAILMILAIF